MSRKHNRQQPENAVTETETLSQNVVDEITPLDPSIDANQNGIPDADEVHFVDIQFQSPVETSQEPVTLRVNDVVQKDTVSFAERADKWLHEGVCESGDCEEQFVEHYLRLAAVQYGDTMREWTVKETLQSLRTGVYPKKTARGFYPNSTVRAGKLAMEWSREELLDYLEGHLRATEKAPEERLYQALLVKWSLPVTWPEKAVRDYILHGKTPPMSKDGFILEDQVRMLKPALHWNREELKAWARGSIPATRLASDTDLVHAARVAYQLSESMSEELVKELLSTMKEEPATMAEIVIKHNLETYAREMKPGKPLTETQAATYQQLLYTTLNRVLKMEGRDFTENWTHLLDFVYAHRTTLFDETRAFRGVSALALSSRDCRNFEQLMNLLLKSCDPTTRYAAVRAINFDVALRDMTSEQLRQKLLAYYRVGQ